MGLEADAAEKRAVGWVIVENFFCLLWITEMLLKLWAFRLAYFRSGWNVLELKLRSLVELRFVSSPFSMSGLRLQPCPS